MAQYGMSTSFKILSQKKKKKLHLKFHMVIGDGQAASYDVEGKY